MDDLEKLNYKLTQIKKEISNHEKELARLKMQQLDIEKEIEVVKRLKNKFNLKSL
jgi:prefoldin subunit 5